MCQHRFLIFMLVLGYHSDCDNMYTEIQSHVYVKGTNKILYKSTLKKHQCIFMIVLLYAMFTTCKIHSCGGRGHSYSQVQISGTHPCIGAFEHFCRGPLNPKFTFDKHF